MTRESLAGRRDCSDPPGLSKRAATEVICTGCIRSMGGHAQHTPPHPDPRPPNGGEGTWYVPTSVSPPADAVICTGIRRSDRKLPLLRSTVEIENDVRQVGDGFDDGVRPCVSQLAGGCGAQILYLSIGPSLQFSE
jgi:hypothetical protein